MTFQPVVALSGYAGWRAFLRSADRQQKAFGDDAQIKGDIAYFREKMKAEPSPAEIVADRRLLNVALTAFGLSEEIGKRAIIRKALEEGVLDPKSFANRLGDPKWRQFAAAFGDDSRASGRFSAPSFQSDIERRYVEQAFEKAIGESDQNVRLALNFRREIATIATGPNVDRVGWLQVTASRPLRAVIEAAFNLPASLASLDVDRQAKVLEERAASVLGSSSASALSTPDNVERVLRRFFAVSETQSGGASSYGLQIATALFPSASRSSPSIFEATLRR